MEQPLSPLASKLVEYSSRQIQILPHTPRLVPSMVLADSTAYFFKRWDSGQIHGYYELQTCEKILAAAKASLPLLCNAYICRLGGLIIDNDDDVLQHYDVNSDGLDSDEEDLPGTRLVGLLLTYIENKGRIQDLAPWLDYTNEDGLAGQSKYASLYNVCTQQAQFGEMQNLRMF